MDVIVQWKKEYRRSMQGITYDFSNLFHRKRTKKVRQEVSHNMIRVSMQNLRQKTL